MAPRAELNDALDTDSQGLKLLPDDALSHLSAEVFHQQTYTTILRERERDRRALTVALNPSAVPGTIINFSPCIWLQTIGT
jgi:hypothetical protein